MITDFKTYKDARFVEMAMQGLSGTAVYDASYLVGLYDAGRMKAALDKKNKQGMLESILGVVSARRNYGYNATETTGIAAKHGYGPLLYLLLMHYSPDGVIPNRVADQINPDAKKVWKQFAEGSGKQLVSTEPLASLVNFSAARQHAEPYLNLRFRLKMPIPGVTEAEKRHYQVVGNDQYQDKGRLITGIFERYLNEELQKVYPEVTELMQGLIF